MKTKAFLLALASASLIAGGQAVAQGRGGGHGGGHGAHAGAQGGLGAQLGRGTVRGGADVGVTRGRGLETRTNARVDSRGPERASDRAIDRANENSVLSGTARTRADLRGLRTGLSVRSSSGVELGTIRRINRSADGSVRSVLVSSATGNRTIPVRPGTLSVSGNVVTTTQMRPPR